MKTIKFNLTLVSDIAKIAAIKVLRSALGVGLKEGKDIVEAAMGRSIEMRLRDDQFGRLLALTVYGNHEAVETFGGLSARLYAGDFSITNVRVENIDVGQVFDLTGNTYGGNVLGAGFSAPHAPAASSY